MHGTHTVKLITKLLKIESLLYVEQNVFYLMYAACPGDVKLGAW